MDVNEYEVMYQVEDRHWWYRGLRKIIGRAWVRHGVEEGAQVLDVGCGTGANMALLSGRASMTGIDISQHALAKCSTRGLDVKAQASANDLPFADESFDAALVMDVLYHKSMPDKQRPVAEASRILKPGGILFLNAPSYQWLYSSHDAITDTDRRFTRGEILGLVRSAGLEPLHATYWNTILFPAIVVTRLWRKIRPLPGSDLKEDKVGILSFFFGKTLALERALTRVVRLPFGLSIFVVARKV